ncbi:TasA family protein [Rossellomorea vietnamensis]|uniref:TasA family protein n=1 Tax=Rossellomorea vietnamensis TaxID=218284 RepID=UPI003CEB3EA7
MGIKKKLGLGVASLAMGAALVGGGTFAYFNDTESSTGNTFAAGTIDLKPELTGSALWNLPNQQPGATFDTGTQTLSNDGTLPGDLTMDLTVADTDGAINGTGVLSDVIEITGLYINGTESLSTFTLDSDSSGAVELKELNGAKLDLGSLAAKGSAGDSVTLRVTGEFPDSGSPQNQYQKDSVAVDFTFELKQQ